MDTRVYFSGFLKTAAKTALACLALALPVPALSAVLHEQQPIDGGEAAFSSVSSGEQNADDFTVSGSEHIESLTWWGSYDAVDTDDFIVRFLSGSSGAPDSMVRDYQSISVAVTPTALTDGYAAPVYRYDFTLPDSLVLPSGSFYVSIMNETQNSAWYWLAGSGGDAGHWSRAVDGDSWSLQAGADLAFSINGTRLAVLAEPSSPMLFIVGLLPLLVSVLRYRVKMR